MIPLRVAEGVAFGVGLADALVPAAPDHLTIAHHDRSHGGVRTRRAEPLRPFGESLVHESLVFGMRACHRSRS